MSKKKTNLRKEMESTVIAVNKHLKDEVTKMTEYKLLANMCPLDREYFYKYHERKEKL